MSRDNNISVCQLSRVKYSFIYFCLIVIPFIVGCNKTEDFEDLDLLIKKEWHLISREQNNINITEICDLDDVLLFENESNFNHDYSTLNCFDYEEDKKGNKWKMIDDFTVLRMKYWLNDENPKDVLIEYWKIIELSDTLLIVEDALAGDNDQIPEIRTYKN